MTNTLNPEALKAQRERHGWAQKDLAQKSNCSTTQISRWECGKHLNINKNSRDRLTGALGISWEVLTRTPDDSNGDSLLYQTAKLNTRVRQDTRTNLELVSRIYGVHWATIIELAPLLFIIAAQNSLNDRRKKIARGRTDRTNY